MRLIGKTIGHYKIVDVLGTGGMATVYRATQTKQDIARDVAIKVMAGAYAHQPDFVQRFKQEAELFARLEHPHILPIYDYGEQDGNLYLVLRLMDGGSLEAQVLKRTMSLPALGKVFKQIASALDYAHGQEVIHRDLKPNNVLLDASGNAYLMDFGIAKILSGARMTATGTLLGTPAYMAPEQWKMDPIDGRVDIYSLGLMLYEVLTGDLPFAGETPFQFMYAHLHETAPPISQKLSSLSEAFDEVIWKATAKNPDDRYSTVTEMAEALQDAIRETDAPVTPEQGLRTKKRGDQLGKILVALERSESGLYAVPKMDDFVKPSHDKTTAVHRPANQMDDIFGSLENKPPTQTFDTHQMHSILSQGQVSQTVLGVSAQPVNLPGSLSDVLGQKTGLLIIGVEDGGPAAEGGLHIGDILVTLAGEPLRNQDDLRAILSDEYAGQTVPVTVVRAGEQRQLTVVPARRGG